MGSTENSLVLGVLTTLGPEHVRPFVRSLRRSGFQGRLAIVTGRHTAEQREAVHALADVAADVDGLYLPVNAAVRAVLRTVRATRRVRRAYPMLFSAATQLPRGSGTSRWAAWEYQLEGLQSLRYKHYLDVIRDLGPDVDQVFVSDLRDVIFQDDPFATPLAGLEVFLEEPSVTTATEAHNRAWALDLYGSQALQLYGSETVSCSGTTAGRRDDMVAYLHAMEREIAGCTRPLGSHDQAAHNHLIRSGGLPEATVVANGEGRVLTMGALTAPRLDNGFVRNTDGSVPAVLHQYDRFPALVPELLERFC